MSSTGRAIRALAAEVLALPYRLRFGSVGRRPRMFPPLLTRGARNIHLGDDARVHAFATLSAGSGGHLRVGSRFEMGSFAKIDADIGSIRIGDNTSVNPFTLVNGFGGVEIGSGVRIASHCVILSSTHRFDDPTLPIETQGVVGLGTYIEDDVWLGAHVVVLGGVRIGAHSVVGAGSVVVSSLPPYSVAVGAPARVVRTRENDQPSE